MSSLPLAPKKITHKAPKPGQTLRWNEHPPQKPGAHKTPLCQVDLTLSRGEQNLWKNTNSSANQCLQYKLSKEGEGGHEHVFIGSIAGTAAWPSFH